METTSADVQSIPLKKVKRSKTNPRKTFDEQKIQELADSIKSYGLLQPITVRPKGKSFEIAAGERRWRAAKIAELKEIDCIVKELTDEQMMDIQAIENLQREDIKPIEEARALNNMVKSGRSIQDIADKIGRSYDYVDQHLKILDLSKPLLELMETERLSFSKARFLARLDKKVQQSLYEEYYEDKDSPEQDPSLEKLKQHVKSRYSHMLSAAPWDLSDNKLYLVAGSCSDCPKRTDRDGKLFYDQEDPQGARCMDRFCWDTKLEHHICYLIRKFADDKNTIFLKDPHHELSEGVEEEVKATGIKVIDDTFSNGYDVKFFVISSDSDIDQYHKEAKEEGYYIKALHLSGFRAGHILRAKKKEKEASEKTISEATPAEEIEIRKNKEERKEQLDETKVHLQLQEKLSENEVFNETDRSKVKDRLTVIQGAAFCLLSVLSTYDERHKPLEDVVPSSWRGNGKAWERLQNKYDTPNKALALLETAMCIYADKEFFISQSAEADYNSNDLSVFVRYLANMYIPDDLNAIQSIQDEKAKERKKKLRKKIKQLKKQISEEDEQEKTS